MSQQRQNFIHRNEGFDCSNCGFGNESADAGCRNHCTQCLYSLHVDAEVPGDRASKCGALMKPVGLEQDAKRGHMIIHECQKCGKSMRNKAAKDDSMEAIIALSTDDAPF